MGKKKIQFSLVYRDMWQSSGKFQPRKDQLERIAPVIIDMGCFSRVETNGGAFEQVNLMAGMYKEVLNQNQLDLLPIMASFKREYYLVGGTAIALYLGHRRSIDFDMFKYSTINHTRNLEKLSKFGYEINVTRRVTEHWTCVQAVCKGCNV